MLASQDIRFALRQMASRPGFAIVAILVLAIGIGSVTAGFAVLYQALLKPLPYPGAERLFFVHNAFPKSQVALAGVSGYDYAEIKKRSAVFTHAGAYFYNDLNLTGAGTAQHVDVVNASSSMFDVFGVSPIVGRIYSEAENQYGADGRALLSEGMWRQTFASDPKILGRLIYLNGRAFTVIGVMPKSFQFPSRETQLWIPLGLRQGNYTLEGGRLEKWLQMVARLAPGVSVEKAQSSLDAFADQLGSRLQQFYPTKDGWHFSLRALAEEQTEHVRRWLYLAFAAVAAVLLIACINVSGLLLIRGTARQTEMSIRLAVGASRLRVVRQLMTETGVLAFAGCLAGMALAVAAIHFVNLYGPLPPTPPWSWALLFAPLTALLGTLISGIIPAFGVIRFRAKPSHWRDLVVASQIAIALTLLFTAILLNRSFLNLTRRQPGFASARLWTGSIDLPNNQHCSASQSWNVCFFSPLLEELSSLPGVESASAGNALPFNPSGVWTEALNLPGHPKQNPPPEALISLAFPNYFETMKIPLLHGRTFSKQDSAGAPPVAVIDDELARRYFPGHDPIGKQIGSGGGDHPATIVGVVESVQNSDLGSPSEPEVYFPALQERTEEAYIVLRMKADLDPTSAVRRIVAKLDPGAALFDVRFMEQRVAHSLELRRFIALLLNALAAIGLLLAIVGLYGSLAHLVELRQREIGIRSALGAGRPQIANLILSRCAAVIGLGMIAGTLGAISAGRAVEHQLFGVDTGDPVIWAIVLVLISLVGAISAYLPAWRAVQVDPAIALRHE